MRYITLKWVHFEWGNDSMIIVNMATFGDIRQLDDTVSDQIGHNYSLYAIKREIHFLEVGPF